MPFLPLLVGSLGLVCGIARSSLSFVLLLDFPEKVVALGGEAMVKVSVFYPNGNGTAFDMEY